MYPVNNQHECDMAEINGKGFCIYSLWINSIEKAEKVDGGRYVQMCVCAKHKPLYCPYIIKRF